MGFFGKLTRSSAQFLGGGPRNTNEQVKSSGRNLVGRAGARIEIQPGTVEIKTSSNTVLKFLTKPITKTLSESMGER